MFFVFLSHSPSFRIVDHGVEAEKQRKGKQSFVYPPCLESLRDDETGNEKYPQGDRRERLVFWDFCDRNLWLHEGMGREGERRAGTRDGGDVTYGCISFFRCIRIALLNRLFKCAQGQTSGTTSRQIDEP